MLADLAHYLVTPASLEARRHGFLGDAVRLWSRSRRCRAAWAPHHAACRAAVDAAIDHLPRRHTAVVLGSGLLDDVPIARMASMFHTVVLVDAVHLAAVRLKVRGNGWTNVRFLATDISGYDALLERQRLQRRAGAADVGGRLDPLAFVRRIPNVDLVVSAMVLSRIAKAPARRPNYGGPGGHAAALINQQLQAMHVDSLAGLAARTLLLTDTSYALVDRADTIVDEGDLLPGIRLPAESDSWSWTVAPFCEEARDLARLHHVVAIDDVALDLG
ncbi:hypothetical protein [Mongoliimonas terrestris]|uniref:hypothetical protein n=1 Tax=Mongoliimonas terrestris TaxID=1709001 RepID=UPI0009498A5A|nr:hypothetical protein [Mongoliimonas terrestris]